MLLSAPLWGQAPTDVTVTLAAKDGRPQFRVGEPIELELRFQSSAPGKYAVWTNLPHRDARNAQYDRFTVQPVQGVADPLADAFAQQTAFAIFGRMPEPAPLAGGPVTVELFLNEWLSFRQPGHYRVTADTTRAVMAPPPAPPQSPNARLGLPEPPGPAVPLTSSALEIDIVAPEPGWAAAQLAQAVAVLERPDPPGPQIGQRYDMRQAQASQTETERAALTLRCLETPEAARAMVRFYENGRQYAQQQVRAGINATPNRKEAIAAMEEAVAAPDIGITYGFLGTLMELTELTRFGPMPPSSLKTPEDIRRSITEVEMPYHERAKGTEDEIWAKLAAALPHKQGAALAVSLQTIVSRGGGAATGAAVKGLLDNFTLLPEETQRQMLTTYWPRIGSPDANPLLKSLAEGSGAMRDLALARLLDIDPEAARAVILRRVGAADLSRGQQFPHVLLQLPDKTLPEMDDALATAVEQGKFQADLLLARYASEAAYPRVRALAEHNSHACGGGILAYLFRVDPQFAADYVTRVRAANLSMCSFMGLSPNEEMFMSPALERQVIQDLTSAEHVRNALTILQYGGSVAAKQPLMDAMLHWRDIPPPAGPRGTYLDGAFADALVQGVGWVLTNDELDHVEAACSSDYCRQRVSSFRREFAQPVSISLVIGMNDLMYARVGSSMIRSPRQLESKIAAYPEGTSFYILGSDSGTWFGDLRTRETRAMLDAHGMKVVAQPRP
jgi:hypothetical protein